MKTTNSYKNATRVGKRRRCAREACQNTEFTLPEIAQLSHTPPLQWPYFATPKETKRSLWTNSEYVLGRLAADRGRWLNATFSNRLSCFRLHWCAIPVWRLESSVHPAVGSLFFGSVNNLCGAHKCTIVIRSAGQMLTHLVVYLGFTCLPPICILISLSGDTRLMLKLKFDRQENLFITWMVSRRLPSLCVGK